LLHCTGWYGGKEATKMWQELGVEKYEQSSMSKQMGGVASG